MNIPEITPAAEELSKMATLEEVRQKWTKSSLTPSLFSMAPTTGALCRRTGTGLRRSKKAAKVVRTGACAPPV